MYDSINDFDVLAKNSRNITAILKTELPSVIDRNTVKNLNKAIFYGIELKEYKPGTFRNPAPAGDLNVSSRELKSQSDRIIYSMRSYMDNNSLIRFDSALNLIKIEELKQLNTKEFTEKISFIYAALDYTHPFYDGNSRTFRTFTELVAKQSGYDLNWKKIAADQFLRDELYCARSIEVNRLALKDPAQTNFQHIINNMLEDLSDKRDLSELFRQQKIITPHRALVFHKTVNNCLKQSGNDFKEFSENMIRKLENDLSAFPEITGSLQVFAGCVKKEAESGNREKAFGNFYYAILPAFYDMLQQGEKDISSSRLTQKIVKLQKLEISRQNEIRSGNTGDSVAICDRKGKRL